MRETKGNFVTDTALHLAKRELHRLLHSPKVWIGVLAVGVVAGVSGPFGTIDHLTLAPRVLYWLALSTSAFFLGSGLGTYVHQHLKPRLPDWLATVAAGVAVGLVLTLILSAINWAVFDIAPFDAGHLLATFANVAMVSLIVTVAFVAFDRIDDASQTNATTPDDPAVSPLMRRLPLEKRGALLALSATDHYVDVVTSNGNALILLRLSDAIELAEGVTGLRVHRSHWVARNAIASTRRDNGRLVLRLTDGRDISVSRTYVPTVKDAGITPE